MAELMLRLRSGGKIVGYEHILNGEHYQADTIEGLGGYCLENDSAGGYLLFDVFDLGMKENDAWHFEGDQVLVNGEMHTLVFTEDHHDFALQPDEGDGENLAFWYVAECGHAEIEWVEPEGTQ
jgi:hypothetical protein